jgi:hypothetical protein
LIDEWLRCFSVVLGSFFDVRVTRNTVVQILGQLGGMFSVLLTATEVIVLLYLRLMKVCAQVSRPRG